MQGRTVKKFFRQSSVVEHYAHATNNVGLWVSEELIFKRYFQPDNVLLELGCGAGRIAIGLWELGYRRVTGIDFSSQMVSESRRIATALRYDIDFQFGDATQLRFAENSFDGAIFGFNGLMQIPGRENRRRAMAEIFRVIKPGSWFVFTAHDREAHWRKSFWKSERKLWNAGEQHPDLEEFGDIYYETEHGGYMFIHSPTPNEVREDLKSVGFRIEADRLRSQLASESDRVRDFSDDCRFWVAQKPLKVAAAEEGSAGA